ncbi:MAG: tRNA uridine(34) 5-carboxymethylaminomethyl modification radical SAM/GNAT enzyme Elp3 [Nanoarchaeota archaeon]|nr:tRNA uridine(34) 5-carboxymethylaminomethyl modification radical SAM/GNAT enzyme Elp3 [Nanoarchaeota archaeon]
MDFYSELAERIAGKDISKQDLNRLKNVLCKKYSLKKIPTDAEIMLNMKDEDIGKVNLVTKPTRTKSGVAPIAVMTAPSKCPHGTCIYCPGGKGSIFGDVPQSYTGNEPSTMRSMRHGFDPYLVVLNRLEQYIILNQNPEKVEVIIQGGTFLAMPEEYKQPYVAYIFKALNDFSEQFYSPGFDYAKFKRFFELPGNKDDMDRSARIEARMSGLKGKADLETEKKRNETAAIRCVGLTIETKPDWALLPQAEEMLSYGCTRVELGVQATDDAILKKLNRGHLMKETIQSTQILKDLGFKINYHMMPGLPGSSKEKDLEMLKETLENPLLRPDMYKIYPTLVMKGTPLYDMYKQGKYKPIETKDAAEVIAEFKRSVPRWIRIMRVQRDIPTNVTEAGVDKTNLRQYVEKICEERKIKCQCIRCREAGLLSLKEKSSNSEIEIFIEQYAASHGEEFFISFESKDRALLYGYCRLRFPGKSLQSEITPDSAIVRELHVIGTAVGIGEQGQVQHKGLGKSLLAKAEDIAKVNGKKKMVVISGVGVREYYKRLGYRLEGPYMVKSIM